MRVLLDECLPRRLRGVIPGHTVTTVPQAGWASKKNGALLRLIAGAFDAFITIDKNLPAQQATAALPFGIVVLRCRSNRIEDLQHLGPAIVEAPRTLQPGQIVRLP